MRYWPLLLLIVILALLEATLFNFSAFRLPITLAVLLFIIEKEDMEEILVVAISGGLVLDLCSFYWWGAHIFYFVAVALILTRPFLDRQIFKGTIAGFFVYFGVFFIFMEISNLTIYTQVIINSIIISLIFSAILSLAIKTKFYKR